jgi:GTPase SAR1 family protein
MKKETINAVSKSGDTALHYACRGGHLHTVDALLKSGEFDPLKRNSHSLTAIEGISDSCQQKTAILKLFYPFITSHDSNSFVLDAYAKVFICGNSGNGKSSLCQVVSQYLYHGNEFISNVVPLTAGIDVFTADLVSNRKVVNSVLYDFAGHPEYYSSHSAILENMLSSPAVFVILVKLTDTESAIKKQLYYWCNFIEDISIKTSCQVIVVGSYADEASDDQVIRMKSVIDGVVQQAITRQSYKMPCLAVDCHRTIGKGVEEFISVLAVACYNVIDRSHQMSYFCCTHYSFICDLKKHEKVITVEDLCSRLEEHNHPSLPSDETTVIQSLHEMKYLNLILWLPDNENVSKGWLVIDQKALLKDINGVLFAPPAIGRVHHPNLSSNTGLISISTLASTFPSYDIHMLIGFLTTLQFCQVIKNETLKSINTNIRSSNEESMTSEDVLFFPSLVSIERGNDDVHVNGHFGWSLYCSDGNKFFSNRFLHIVLLHLALNHSLCKRPRYGEIDERPPDVRRYDRQCHMWKNGIYWKDGSNEMEVEITDHNRCLTLLLSKCDKGKSLRIACTIISDILNLLKNHCSFTPHQYLISPHQLVNIHEVPINDRIVYHIQDIRKALDDEEDKVNDVKQKNPILISELFGGFDPKVVLACCMGCGDNPSTEKSKAPNHSELLYLLVPISAKWEHIGLALKVEHNIIDGLRRNEVDNTLRLSKILHAWINKDNNVTWDTIIQAIEGPIVDNKALVKEIMELKELSY